MFRKMRVWAGVGASCLATMLVIGPATAAMSPADEQAYGFLMRQPSIVKMVMLSRKGDKRAAMAGLMAAARQGDPAAEVVLGRFYFQGYGSLKRNPAEAMKWLKLALASHQAPIQQLVMSSLAEMSAAGQRAAGKDKVAGFVAGLAPYAALAPRRAPSAAVGSNAGDGYFGRKVFNGLTDHQFDPFPGPGE